LDFFWKQLSTYAASLKRTRSFALPELGAIWSISSLNQKQLVAELVLHRIGHFLNIPPRAWASFKRFNVDVHSISTIPILEPNYYKHSEGEMLK
jgi:hypothetical protein